MINTQKAYKQSTAAINYRFRKRAAYVLLTALMCAALLINTIYPAAPAGGFQIPGFAGTVEEVTGQVDSLSTQFLQTADERVVPRSDEEVSVIVRLSDKPLIGRLEMTGYQNIRDYALSYEGRSYARDLSGRQQSVKTALSREFDIEFVDSYTTLLDGFSARIKYGEVERLREADGIYKVMVSPRYAEPQSAPVSVSNPVKVYESGIYDSSDVAFDGTGTVVGIFDTGLDYTHPAFKNMPDPSKLALDRNEVSELLKDTATAAQNPNISVEQVYINDKIPFAYDYADRVPEVYPKESHGTHVAGIVAGTDDSKTFESGQTFTGVAPGAQLAIFKVFSSNKQGAEMSNVLTALSDAALLNIDVINMSLGAVSGFSSEEDEGQTNEIYENLRRAGVSVIVSAGNEGSSATGSEKGSTNLVTNPDSGTVGSPGSYKSVMTVASIDGVLSDYFIAEGITGYITDGNDMQGKKIPFSAGMLNGAAQKEFEYVAVPGLGRPSNYAAVDVKGKIALVRRGTINFEEKIKNAYYAGATGVIIYNNISGVINMSVGKANMIPSCSITMDIGEELAAKESGKLVLSTGYKAGPFISDFSSWGVTPDMELKPEITAHGGNITSSVPGGYDSISGTSMAAPNLAGAVTILRQYVKEKYPQFSAVEVNEFVNRLLMSTATVANNEQGNPYSPRKQGAGLASLFNAVNTEAYLYVEGSDKTKLTAGDDKNKTGVYDLEFRLKNLSGAAKSYRVVTDTFTESLSTDRKNVAEKAYMLSGGSVEVSSPDGYANGNIVTVAGFSDIAVRVKIKLTADEKKYIDDSFANGMFVEGFVKLEAYRSDNVALNIPWVGFYGDWTRAPIFDITAYQAADSERDISVLDTDKLKPDIFGSIPMGAFDIGERDGEPIRGVWGMGEYAYSQPDSAAKILPYEDRAAISQNYSAMNELEYVALGTLRGAKTAKIEIVNDVTGESVYSGVQNNVRKTVKSGGRDLAGGAEVKLLADSAFLANNTKYNIFIEGYLDWPDGGAETNLNNTYTSSFYIDSDAPILERERLALRVEERNNVKRYYLDMFVYDNHYMQAMYMVTYKDIVDNSLTNATYFNNYMVPVESQRNSTTKVTYEITDYWNQIRANGDKLYVEFTDYALNTSGWTIVLPQRPVEGLNFVNPGTERKIDKEQTIDLKNDIKLTPEDAWLYGITWESSIPAIATVSSDGIVTGISEGSTVITATAYNGGQKVEASVTVKVSNDPYTKKLERLVLDKPTINAVIGDEGIITVSVVPYNFPPDLNWVSAFPDIVSVDKIPGTNGTQARYKVLAASSGIINLWVTDRTSDLIRGNCQINVRPPYTTEGSSLNRYYGKGKEGVVDIPADLELMYINSGAFQNNTNIKKVIIPEGVKSIGQYAFENCTALEEVVLPSTCETIDEGAFTGCGSLVKVNLTHVKTIAAKAFMGTRLNALDLKNTLFIGDYAFTASSSGVPVFSEADLSNVKYIGVQAFAHCYSLTEAVIAAGTISDGAFGACLNLAKVTFLNKVNIGNEAFLSCEKLKEVTFLNGCSVIGSQAFYACSTLASIRIPEGTELIGSEAFGYCAALTTVHFSADARVSAFGTGVFYGTKVAAFTLESGSSTFTVDANGVLYDISKTRLILYPYARTSNSFTVPATVNTICSMAFSGAANLETVSLGGTSVIERGAFYGCPKLTTVNFNSNQTYVGESAFADCRKLNLTCINYMTAVSYIGASAFNMYNVRYDQDETARTITVPASVSFIGDSAFSYSLSLASINLSNSALTELNEFMFYYCENLNSVSLPAALTTIGQGAFARCAKISSINLPAGITELGAGAFLGCTALKNITLPGGITYLAQSLFAYSGIENVTLPAKVTEIGDSAFFGCTSFTGFTNGLENITHIYDMAFCLTQLTELDAPNAVYAGSDLFTYFDADIYEVVENTTLVRVNLPKVLSVSPYAFENCTALAEVNIGSVQNIGARAFASCGSLETLIIGNVETIGAYAFTGTAITQLSLPASLVKLNEYALSGMDSLSIIESAGEKYFTIDGVLYSLLPSGGWQLEKYPAKKAGESYTVADGTKRIAPEAFIGNKILKEITLARTLLSIGDGAFDDTSITVYKFTSPYMPVLEGYLTSDSRGNYVNYKNFKGVYLDISGLTMVRPSNGIGYDTYIVRSFFGTSVEGDPALFDATVEVIRLIAALPETITLADKRQIKQARQLYDLLVSSQQALVSNYSKLTAAESTWSALEISDLISSVNALPKRVKLADEEKVMGLYERYNELTDAEKTLVTNSAKLLSAVERINKLKKPSSLPFILGIVFGSAALIGAGAVAVILIRRKKRSIEQ